MSHLDITSRDDFVFSEFQVDNDEVRDAAFFLDSKFSHKGIFLQKFKSKEKVRVENVLKKYFC